MIIGAKAKKKKKGNKSSGMLAMRMNDERWEIERDLDAIARADAVRADPERMKKVKALARERLDESKRKKDEAEKLIALGQE
ncbi:MAG: hypothetical protein Q8P12_01030 [bacterium]|nr:hypothetical protein [bacterium]